MAEANIAAPKRYAIVTGANKGIGFEICRQLASKGVTVVLTARDEKKGIEALEKLKASGPSDNLVFHQLDAVSPSSIASLADFIRTQFGRLDILVNNAGIAGTKVDVDALKAAGIGASRTGAANVNWGEISTETYELAVECLQTNYYGVKRICEAFIPLLQLSDAPRIVNVSSSLGKLKNIPNEWAKGILSEGENLAEEKVNEVVNEFLKDFKVGTLQAKGWPSHVSAYTVSKAALNAYTRVLAKRYPTFCINSVCPGFVKTDLNFNMGIFSVEQGAEGPVKLAFLPNGGPSGLFFDRQGITSFE